MNSKSTNTDQLIQKIIDRQAELAELSTAMFRSKPKKEIKENKVKYAWFEEIKNERNVFNLSKAV